MKRHLTRGIASSLIVGVLSAALVQPALARPRSWFLPPLNVSCTTGDGKTEAFSGALELYNAGILKGVLTVAGSVSGSCGPLSIDTLFRAPVTVDSATCSEATFTLGDITVRDTTIALSEAPITVTSDGKSLKGALCSLAGASRGSLKAQAKALDKLLSLAG